MSKVKYNLMDKNGNRVMEHVTLANISKKVYMSVTTVSKYYKNHKWIDEKYRIVKVNLRK